MAAVMPMTVTAMTQADFERVSRGCSPIEFQHAYDVSIMVTTGAGPVSKSLSPGLADAGTQLPELANAGTQSEPQVSSKRARESPDDTDTAASALLIMKAARVDHSVSTDTAAGASDNEAGPATSKHRNARFSWNDADDALLLTKYSEHGGHWAAIAREMPGRSGPQCRERYCNKLDPAINRAEFTTAEDELLLRLSNDHCKRWSLITRLLGTHRTDYAVRKRFLLLTGGTKT